MLEYLSGAVTMGFAISSLFFVRFWLRSRDGLFLFFAVALALLALSQAIIGLTADWHEEYTWVFVLRLAAFLLIIGAIAKKNLARDNS